MTADPRWDPAALQDLQDGVRWYEAREPGLGRELVVETFKALDHAVRHPFAPKRYEHPKLPAEPEFRKVPLRRFSGYGLVYTVINDTFWVVAVDHAKRRPGFWVDRVKKLTWLSTPSPPRRNGRYEFARKRCPTLPQTGGMRPDPRGMGQLSRARDGKAAGPPGCRKSPTTSNGRATSGSE